MRWADCHVHLSDYSALEQTLKFASERQIRLFSVSTGHDTALTTLELSKRFRSSLKSFIGIHPSAAVTESELDAFSGLLDVADGIGEIGLDPTYSETTPGRPQATIFASFLELAEKHDKPVQVHTRKAERQCLDLLGVHKLKVLLHWFEGEALLEEAAQRGYFVSVGPAVLYSKKLERIARAYPLDLILTESDGPVSFPPLGGVGGPLLVPSVIFRLAEILKLDLAELAERLFDNSVKYLG